MLFSEPKIPQSIRRSTTSNACSHFQCSSASRKFLNRLLRACVRQRPANFQCSSASRKFLNRSDSITNAGIIIAFQCSSASRKFLNPKNRSYVLPIDALSVLFSEPKIPQSPGIRFRRHLSAPFSALQRAENSSITSCDRFLKGTRISFSALQRAENSSIEGGQQWRGLRSAFSALQRAENSSIRYAITLSRRLNTLSVLFSEPKIPQYVAFIRCRTLFLLSVLFSEPKIPQSLQEGVVDRESKPFSALQRAENSSILLVLSRPCLIDPFQCSSASRKFLNYCYGMQQTLCQRTFQCSSASRKFLNLDAGAAAAHGVMPFSALQRAENSSIRASTRCRTRSWRLSVLFSEPKIPQSFYRVL